MNENDRNHTPNNQIPIKNYINTSESLDFQFTYLGVSRRFLLHHARQIGGMPLGRVVQENSKGLASTLTSKRLFFTAMKTVNTPVHVPLLYQQHGTT